MKIGIIGLGKVGSAFWKPAKQRQLCRSSVLKPDVHLKVLQGYAAKTDCW